MSNIDDMKEKLSALVDNELDELDERRVMKALEQDPELRQTWERYHLVHSVLHQELDTMVASDMAARVAAQIESEPATSVLSQRRRTARIVGTLAMAASVAVVAVAAVQWFNRPPVSATAALVAGQPASGNLVAAQVTSVAEGQPAPDNFIRAGATHWDVKEPETESTLNTFLVEHNEFASSSGIGGMMPYVRVVGYDNPAK
ncbi:MAG: RseA family anti-sigma factor [Pseudomonadota bacterium]